jgi:hypothetical protein
VPSSISRVVRDDHERLPRLLRRVVRPGPSRQRWRDELLQLLHAHRAAEQDVLTSEVLGPAGHVATEAARDLTELDRDLLDAVQALADAAFDSASLARLGERLGGLLDQHCALTDQALGALESALARKQLRLLGGRYAEVRAAALHDEGAAEPPPRRLDLPRAELYELARKAGIEGRSAMSRGELIAELQDRQQHEPS